MTGSIYVRPKPMENTLARHPVMVSIIRDGVVERQSEIHLDEVFTFFNLPIGQYDVRFEGEGLETLVKRGIHVSQSSRTDVIGGPMRAGEGVHVIEYAVGCSSREEVSARLQSLEATVDRTCTEVVSRLDRLAALYDHLREALIQEHENSCV